MQNGETSKQPSFAAFPPGGTDCRHALESDFAVCRADYAFLSSATDLCADRCDYLRAGAQRWGGCRCQRYLPADIHLFAVCLRLYQRLRRADRALCRVRGKGRCQALACGADLSFRCHFRRTDGALAPLTPLDAGGYPRDPDQQRGLRCGVYLLLCYLSRHCGADGVQFYLRDSPIAWGFGHAAAVSGGLHCAERGAGLAVSARLSHGTRRRGDCHGRRPTAQYGRVFCLRFFPLSGVAPEKNGLAGALCRDVGAPTAGNSARVAVFDSCHRHYCDARGSGEV